MPYQLKKLNSSQFLTTINRKFSIFMKYYDLLFKKPLILSILALIIVYLTDIDIFQELIIFAIIGIFYTFKNKEVIP